MSRWIDVDALETRSAFWSVGVKGKALDTFIKLSEVPTIDIVCCRECKKWHNGWCYKHGRAFEPYDFCSYGEREGE